MGILPFQLALATTAEPPFIDKEMYGLRKLMLSIQRRFYRCCHR